jgi:hypothetical protein
MQHLDITAKKKKVNLSSYSRIKNTFSIFLSNLTYNDNEDNNKTFCRMPRSGFQFIQPDEYYPEKNL